MGLSATVHVNGILTYCLKSADYLFAGLPTQLQASINSLNVKLNADIDSLYVRLSSKLDGVVTSNDPDTVISSCISEWATTVGDTQSGLLGGLIQGVNVSVGQINAQLTTRAQANKCVLYDIDEQQGVYSTSVASIASGGISKAVSTVNQYNTNFYNKVTSVSAVAFKSRLSSQENIFMSNVNTARDLVISGLASLLANVKSGFLSATSSNTPEILVNSVVNDTNSSLQALYAVFNTSVTNSSNEFTSAISAIKYASSDSSTLIQSSYDRCNTSVDNASKQISSAVDKFSTDISAQIGAYSDSVLSLRLSALTSKYTSQMNMALSNTKKSMASTNNIASNRINAAVTLINNYLYNISPPSSVDSLATRSYLQSSKNSSEQMVSNAIASYVDQFNTSLKDIFTKHSDTLTSLVDAYNKDLKERATIGSSNAQAIIDASNNNIQSVMGSVNNSVSSYADTLSNAVNQLSITVRQAASNKYNDYIKLIPIIRLTGSSVLPSSVDLSGMSTFTFDIGNSGKSTWRGWFGIKVTDENGISYTYNDKPLEYVFIPPGEVKTIDVDVPFYKVIGNKPIGSKVRITVVVNTYRGESLLPT